MGLIGNRLIGTRNRLNVEALEYISRVEFADGQPLEFEVRNAIFNLFNSLKSDGILHHIKSSALMVGARTLEGALTQLISGVPSVTNFNFTGADYSRTLGLLGDGSTTYIDTNRSNSAEPRIDMHLSIFLSELTSGEQMFASAYADVGGSTELYQSNFEAATRHRRDIRFLSGDLNTGFFGISRSDSESSYVARNNSVNVTHNTQAQQPTNRNIYLFARNSGTVTPTFFSNSRITAFTIGTGVDLALLDTSLSNYISTIQSVL